MEERKSKNWTKLKEQFNLLKPLHYGLILCLANEDYPGNNAGWLKLKEIIKQKNPNTEKPYFTSQKTSIPKYMQYLVKSGLVIEDEFPTNKSKYKQSKINHWRLKQDFETFLLIREHIGNYDVVNNFYLIHKDDLLLPIFDKTLYAQKFLKGDWMADVLSNSYFEYLLEQYYYALDEFNQEKMLIIERQLLRYIPKEELTEIKRDNICSEIETKIKEINNLKRFGLTYEIIDAETLDYFDKILFKTKEELVKNKK